MQFSLTPINVLLISLAVVFCVAHMPLAFAGYMLGIVVSLSFLFYQLGKMNGKETEQAKQLQKMRIQAEEIEALLPLVEMFPDVEELLTQRAAKLYDAIGEPELAAKLRNEIISRQVLFEP